jgi:hypothetical protein
VRGAFLGFVRLTAPLVCGLSAPHGRTPSERGTTIEEGSGVINLSPLISEDDKVLIEAATNGRYHAFETELSNGPQRPLECVRKMLEIAGIQMAGLSGPFRVRGALPCEGAP